MPLAPPPYHTFFERLPYGTAAYKSIVVQKRLTVSLVEPRGNPNNVESEEKDFLLKKTLETPTSCLKTPYKECNGRTAVVITSS